MKVRITAIRTAGFGCIKGDTKTYDNVQMVEDKGDRWIIVKSRSKYSVHEIIVSKNNWSLEILQK